MSHFITLSQIQVQNANCIAGITYGFPAVTHFLGFVHALSIKLQKSQQITLDGCAIVCHQHQVHAYRVASVKDGRKIYSDYYFKQSKNPAAFRYQEKNIGGDTPIIEEGKMHLTVTLVIECNGFNGGQADINQLLKHLNQLCYTHKLAGGVIINIKDIFFDSINNHNDFFKLRRRLMPGFIILDRSEYLVKHFSNLQEEDSRAQLLDAWLDFSSLKDQAIPQLENNESLSAETNAKWERILKQFPGWLVPIMTGYRTISKLYDPGVVARTRDPSFPFCFVEAAYGIGEWLSPYRINDLQQAVWHYTPPENGWYLCKQVASSSEAILDEMDDDMDQYLM